MIAATYEKGYDRDERIVIDIIESSDNHMVLFTTGGKQLPATGAYWCSVRQTMIFYCPENF